MTGNNGLFLSVWNDTTHYWHLFPFSSSWRASRHQEKLPWEGYSRWVCFAIHSAFHSQMFKLSHLHRRSLYSHLTRPTKIIIKMLKGNEITVLFTEFDLPWTAKWISIFDSFFIIGIKLILICFGCINASVCINVCKYVSTSFVRSCPPCFMGQFLTETWKIHKECPGLSFPRDGFIDMCYLCESWGQAHSFLGWDTFLIFLHVHNSVL